MMVLPGPQILLMYFFIQTTKTCSPIIVCIVCHNADGILNAKVLLIEKEEGGEDCSDSLTSSKRLLFSRDAHSPNRPLSVSHTSVSSSSHLLSKKSNVLFKNDISTSGCQ